MKFYEFQDLSQTGIDEKYQSGLSTTNAAWEYSNGDLFFAIEHFSYFSTDGGETWTKVDITDDVADVTEIMSGFVDGSDIYISTNKGVLISSDNGDTWARHGDLTGYVYDVFKLGSDMFCTTGAAGAPGYTMTFRKYNSGTQNWDAVDTVSNVTSMEDGFNIALVNSARDKAYIGHRSDSGDEFRFGEFDGTSWTENGSINTTGSIGYHRYSTMKKTRDCSEIFWCFQNPSGTPQFYISTDSGATWTLITSLTLDLRQLGCMRGDWETGSDVIIIFTNYYSGVAQSNLYFYFLDKADHQQIHYLQDADADLGLTWLDTYFPTEQILIGNDTNGYAGNGDYYAFGYTDIGSKFKKCEIDYLIGKTTLVHCKIYKSFALNRTIVLYNDSDETLFIGTVKEKHKGTYLWFYKFEGFDRELGKLKKTETYTTEVADVIMRDVIDDECRFGYYSSSIDPDGDFITNRTIDFKNTVLKGVFDVLCDYEDAVWYCEPDGKIWCKKYTSLTDSGFTINQGSSTLAGSPEYDLISEPINKVTLYGGYVSGVRITTGSGHGEDLESQRLNGIVEFVDHFPHITDQTQLNNLADAILARTGMGDNPLYIECKFKGLGVPPLGETINFQFTPYTDLATAADYLVQRCRYDARTDIGRYYFSSGAVQRKRERDVENKTSNADEEQIDHVADAVQSHEDDTSDPHATLEGLTADRALETDGSGNIVVSAVTQTELNYSSGVTSAIQTQINALPKIEVGTYTGDDSTDQPIATGFKCAAIFIIQDAGAGSNCLMDVIHEDFSNADMVVRHFGAGGHEGVDNRGWCDASDGFHVDDGGSNAHPNKSGSTYRYIAIKEGE